MLALAAASLGLALVWFTHDRSAPAGAPPSADTIRAAVPASAHQSSGSAPTVVTAADESSATGPSGTSLASLFPRRASFDYQPPRAGTYQLPAVKPAPDAVLLDHTGAPIHLAEQLAGRHALVSFVYLNCADAQGCPVAMATLYEIHDASAQRPSLRQDLQLVTISFDPERDTPEALGAVAAALQADRHSGRKIAWRLFTGTDRPMLEPLLAAYGQPVQAGRSPGEINHLLRMFLIDREGNIRNVYGLGSIDPRLVMTDVETLLIGEQAQR